jgi:hypothetical protein
VLVADLIELNTARGIGGATQTTAPHGKRGFVGGPQDTTPQQIGSDGGNFASLTARCSGFGRISLTRSTRRSLPTAVPKSAPVSQSSGNLEALPPHGGAALRR